LKFFKADPDPGSEICLTLDPGCKKFGFGMFIPDPQHWYLFTGWFGNKWLAIVIGHSGSQTALNEL
jgi:hypothetical protein